ncbi:MAG TPA: shikimate dehydrogenase [Actinomycetota bacterium]|nr:shikimate dehydrogenase [Actinomycetota bacterium]
MSDAAAAAAPWIGGDTRIVGVIGWPVSHSLSPLIHNAAFAALDMNWAYVPLPVPPGNVLEALRGLRALGFAGANVTMPHKTEITALADELTDDARLLRSVNTLVVTTDGIVGHNTDCPGFDRFITRDAGFDAADRIALVFGAGGAARACAVALARAGLRELVVALRDPSRVQSVSDAVDDIGTKVTAVTFEEAPTVTADLVVNATPLGAHDESLPIPVLGPEVLVVDLLYRPHQTPLLAAARDAGASSYGGLGLLLHQAGLAFELWTGRPAPLDVMSAAAMTELAAPGRGETPEG